MYNLPQPPYFLLIFGLFAGITCGLAFEATLKQKLQEWKKSRDAKTIEQVQGTQLRLPFLGICAGICIFLAAGLDIFIMDSWISYALALPLTIFTGALVWNQLGKLLLQLHEGGSKAINLDAWD
ncbi:MAG: hypothetical protein F6K10_23955 [Moorea sp. SIO2B7]|nr:hypothetical protein [Moorena sp. SIO2B7]